MFVTSPHRSRSLKQMAIAISEPPRNREELIIRPARTSCLADAGRARVGHSCA